MGNSGTGLPHSLLGTVQQLQLYQNRGKPLPDSATTRLIYSIKEQQEETTRCERPFHGVLTFDSSVDSILREPDHVFGGSVQVVRDLP